jgi:hypothetical protein
MEGFNFSGNGSDSPGFIEVYIKNIEEKSPETRSQFEKEFLQLYKKAEAKGTEFCAEQFTNKTKEHLANYCAYYILAIVVLVFILNRSR